MTNILGFQTLKICEPHGNSDITVVKIDGNCLVGFSVYFDWIKLQEGPNDFGCSFHAINELDKYNINWELYFDNWDDIDHNCIGKLTLCVFDENLSPIITELLNVEDNNENKQMKFKIFEQYIYNFETEKHMKIEPITTTVTIPDDDYYDSCNFMFEPEIIYSSAKMDYKIAGNFFKNIEKNQEDNIYLNEIISTKIFGDVEFTIWNKKIFTRIKNDNRDIYIELENPFGNINNDNVNQLKKTIDSYEQIKSYSEEYITSHYLKDYRIQDFFIELFLYKTKDSNNINEELDKLIELPIEEKINFIPFSKLIINYLDEKQYSIMLGFYSINKNYCSSLWFHYDNNYCFKYFNVEEG